MVFTNDIPCGASYIMNDGKYFDLPASSIILIGKKSLVVYHCFVDIYVHKEKLYDEYHSKILVLTDNAIAINDGEIMPNDIPYLIMPEELPSNAQFESLLNWLSHVSEQNKFILVKNRDGKDIGTYYFQTINNENGYLPEDIIKEIKKNYAGSEES
jgi:hypothetical protein